MGRSSAVARLTPKSSASWWRSFPRCFVRSKPIAFSGPVVSKLAELEIIGFPGGWLARPALENGRGEGPPRAEEARLLEGEDGLLSTHLSLSEERWQQPSSLSELPREAQLCYRRLCGRVRSGLGLWSLQN